MVTTRYLKVIGWMKGVSLAIIVFGLALAFLNGTGLLDGFNSAMQEPFFQGNDPGASFENYRAWVYGVLGATMAGWGIFMFFLVHHGMPTKQRWVRNVLVIGLGVWYAIDTGISIWFGVVANVLLNTAIMFLALIPLMMVWKEFS